MNYRIGCMTRGREVPAEYKVLTIPARTWAIFGVDWNDEKDDGNLHECWRRIYAEWFPTAGFEHADCDFDLEMYYGRAGIDSKVEIWVPVVKK